MCGSVYADTEIANIWLYDKDCNIINTNKTTTDDDVYYCVGWANPLNHATNTPWIRLYNSTWTLIGSYNNSQPLWSALRLAISIQHVAVDSPEYTFILVKWVTDKEHGTGYSRYVYTQFFKIGKSDLSITRLINNNYSTTWTSYNIAELTYYGQWIMLRYGGETFTEYYSYDIINNSWWSATPGGDWRTNSIPIVWATFLNTWQYEAFYDDNFFRGRFLDTTKLHNYYYINPTHYDNDYFGFSTSGFFDSTPGTIRWTLIGGDGDILVNQANACYSSMNGWTLKGYYYCLDHNKYIEDTSAIMQSDYGTILVTYNTIDWVDSAIYFGTNGNLWTSTDIVEELSDDSITSFIPGTASVSDDYVYWPYIFANRDYSLTLSIFKFVDYEPVLDKTLIMWSYSGVLTSTWVGEAPTIYSSDYSFGQFNNYVIQFNYTNLSDPSDTGIFSYNLYYNPAGIEVDITEDSFTFAIDRINKLPNWFSIEGFRVYPNCWNLSFDIVGPNQAWTWTQEIWAWPFFCWAYDPINGYWTGRTVTVTYPYHEYPGNYSFVMRYSWQNYVLYPFGTWATNYFISQPQEMTSSWYTVDGVYYDEEIWNFDKNGDWEISISEFFSGLAGLPGYYIKQLLGYFGELIKIVKSFGGLGTTETDTWTSWIIWSAYADNSQSLWVMWDTELDTEWYQDTILGKINKFTTGAIYTILLVIGLAAFIVISRKNH